MKPRRSLGVLAVLLMMSGSLLGSEPKVRLQVRESDLGPVIRDKKVALHLAKGARVEGRVREVTANALVVQVKRSSNPAAYPKGTMQVPRASVSGIEVRDLNKNVVKHTALTIGAAMGAFVGGAWISVAVRPHGVGGKDLWVLNAAAIGPGIASGAFAAVLMNLPQRSKNVTLIEVVPDSPGEGQPKPTDREQSSSPKQDASSSVRERLPAASEPLIVPAFKHNGIGAAVPSLVEHSSQERLRQQARRAVMRPGVPLHLSGLSDRPPSVARLAED